MMAHSVLHLTVKRPARKYIVSIMYRLYNGGTRGYRIYTIEGEARRHVYLMTLNPNCITGVYQNAEAFPFPIGSSRAVQCD